VVCCRWGCATACGNWHGLMRWTTAPSTPGEAS
jgi:hypothetical protein